MKKVQLHQRGQRPEAQKGCRSRRGRIPATAACTDGRASAHRYWSDLELRNRGHAIHGLLTALRHHRDRNTVQPRANRRRENPLEIRDLQA